MDILIICVAIVLSFSLGWFFSFRYKAIKLKKIENIELQQYETKLKVVEAVLEEKYKELNNVNDEVAYRNEQLEKTIQQESSILDTVLEQQKSNMEAALSAYSDVLDMAYNATEEEFDTKMGILQEELTKAKAQREANIQAALRERELKEKENFYKISLSEADLADISILEDIKPKLRKPEVLSKLIWTTYYQKNIGTLCNNVIGDKTISGIYKITYPELELVYIGKSVNIAQRWKDHVKAALGAGSAGVNKLYKAMQDYGIHNFTFEVLEEVPAARLDEAEKTWIDFYQANIYGLNTVRGVNK